jgi:hypothetical protein
LDLKKADCSIGQLTVDPDEGVLVLVVVAGRFPIRRL